VATRWRHTGSVQWIGLVAVAVAATLASTLGLVAQSRRDFQVTARRYAFTVAGSTTAEIRVEQDDLVHVTLASEDIPHSFTIEQAPYRIMRRAEPGKPVSFDFRADEAGRFAITCSLTADSRCREMHATLIVSPRR
jgi:heme/copper-type cytochrome/quinol oxidase subunit 2